jgi:hypothetical protein
MAYEMDDESMQQRTSRTSTTLVFLASFAIIASYLGCYAVTNALVTAGLISPFTGEDPRPRWMLNSFLGIFGGFGVLAVLFRWMSNRQLRRIDDMANADDKALF